MSRRAPRSRNALRITRFLACLAAVTALVIGTVAPTASVSASASQGVPTNLSSAVSSVAQAGPVKTTLVGFTPGNLISDAVFTNKSTMTEAQIQAFFNAKVPTCRSGYVCLKDLKIATQSKSADSYCSAYAGQSSESAARIVYKVAQACGINPQVLVVMLQKEQGLVTHTWPSDYRYNAAMGQACPDTAPCNVAFAGFFAQVYGAARQMQLYMEGRYFTWYAPGKTWNVLYHPNRDCGSSPVYIANKATAALYYYTPYQPNAAALAAGSGEAKPCGSYGNRNFYNYFTDWFGPTQTSVFVVSSPSVNGYVVPGQSLRATARFTPAPTKILYQWYRNGSPISGATESSYTLTRADSGVQIYVTTTGQRTGYLDATAQSANFIARSVIVDRIAGASREQTAVEVSRAAWPSGTRTVYLATSLDFPDALSATASASKEQASLLLTTPASLPASVADELKRLAPNKVVLIGGTGVVTESVASQVRSTVPSAAIERVGAADRYATSRAIVERSGASTHVLIATGRDFPDALSAAAAGGASRVPVLLIDGMASNLDPATLSTLRKIGVTNVTLVGGMGVINEAIVPQLQKQGFSTKRLSGNDRYLTNIAVNDVYFPSTALRVFVATGDNFPDALAGSVIAGRNGVPLVLSQSDCLFTEATDFIRTRGTNAVTLIGGAGVLADSGVGELRRC